MPVRLKSLELLGYKTFANRTMFEFAGRVTAIVGPNGSGKSNIADSMRWVLGEQSYSLLRAKRTEDMIFSGSEMRSRSGMASATITFDNSDGWLPIDFSEVAITRRAYRDGTNDYLINGQRVRLKDVSDLLAQSGLAERTYTIIGQGLVDAALALKAEDRRKLFEEAAGIGLYRSRREEAIRRLDTTRRNLERVQDILAELEPRLHSLERQARRALDYDQAKADLHTLLRDWYGYYWHEAQAELMEAREMARLQEITLQQARDEQFQFDVQINELREKVLAVRSGLNAWHHQSAGHHNRQEMLSRQLAVVDERVKSYDHQEANIAGEGARLEDELLLQQEQLEKSAQEIKRLVEELDEARAQSELARQALDRRLGERGKIEKEIQAMREQIEQLKSDQGELQARLAERNIQTGRNRRALEGVETALTQAQAEYDRVKDGIENLHQEETQAENDLLSAEQSYKQVQQELVEAELAFKQAQDELTTVREEFIRNKAQLDVLEQAEKSLVGYADGTRLLLMAGREGKLEHLAGAISQYVQIPPNLEKAVLAGLDGSLEAVILEAEVDAALDLLSREGAPGVLLPLAALMPVMILPPAALLEQIRDGWIGVAAVLVQMDEIYHPARDLLLGEVWIVHDRQTARAVVELLRANATPRDLDRWKSLRVVTLEGEVMHFNGMVSASARASAVSSLLERQRQQAEVKEKLGQLSSRREVLQTKTNDLDGNYKSVSNRVRQWEQARQLANQKLQTTRMAFAQTQLAVEGAERQARWQSEQRKRLHELIAEAETENDKSNATSHEIGLQIAALRQAFAQAEHQLATLPLDEFQEQLAHWGMMAAVIERALGDERSRQHERELAMSRRETQRIELGQRQVAIAKARGELEHEKVNWRKEEANLARQIERLGLLIAPAEANLEGFEGELVGIQASDAIARQNVSQADHRYAQTRILLARRQEAMQSLHRRIEEDFGLVTLEYIEDVAGQEPLPFEGMVEELPRVSELSADLEEAIRRQRALLRRMGPINPEAQIEYREVKERYTFMTEQMADLHHAENNLREVVGELDGLMQKDFQHTFDEVATEFKAIFTRLFGGGSARLVLTNPDNVTDTGIDIEARLPGRRSQSLSLLSGGERSLTATALVFALLRVSPTPFCVLDEVDAMLDESNVGRFRDLLRDLSEKTQFVIVTHNRNTVQVAEAIYGVSMGRDSSSQILSLKLEEVRKVVE